MPSRKPIGKRARFEVFKRDGFTCQYCGATPPRAVLHVDHIKPVKLGGGNDQENLITACDQCNMGKSAVPLSSHPKSLAEKAAEIAEREAQIIGYTRVMDDARERIERDTWRVIVAIDPKSATKGCSRARFSSVKSFVASLGVVDVLDAAEIANSRLNIGSQAAFKYFCGVCWKKIKGTNE